MDCIMKYTQIIIDFIENKQGSAKQATLHRRDAGNAEKSIKSLRILRLCGEISVEYLFPIMSNDCWAALCLATPRSSSKQNPLQPFLTKFRTYANSIRSCLPTARARRSSDSNVIAVLSGSSRRSICERLVCIF